MVDSAARAARWPWIVDAGRRGAKVDSASGTDSFGPWRSCAARRVQLAVWVVGAAISCPRDLPDARARRVEVLPDAVKRHPGIARREALELAVDAEARAALHV